MRIFLCFAAVFCGCSGGDKERSAEREKELKGKVAKLEAENAELTSQIRLLGKLGKDTTDSYKKVMSALYAAWHKDKKHFNESLIKAYAWDVVLGYQKKHASQVEKSLKEKRKKLTSEERSMVHEISSALYSDKIPDHQKFMLGKGWEFIENGLFQNLQKKVQENIIDIRIEDLKKRTKSLIRRNR